VEGIEFGNNAAIGGGGAIYNKVGSTLTVKNGKFITYAAMLGGAIFNNGNLTVEGSSFASNQASGAGGAVFNDSAATITSSSLYGNSAPSGGAIGSEGTHDGHLQQPVG
jgi:hypothetical protein